MNKYQQAFEAKIVDHCAGRRLDNRETLAFLTALLTAIVAGDHLADPDEAEARCLAHKVPYPTPWWVVETIGEYLRSLASSAND